MRYLLLAVLLASCATQHPADLQPPKIEALVSVSAVAFESGKSVPLEGVACTLTNDTGRWSAITPALVRIPPSDRAVEFECAKEGYRSVSGVLSCSRTYYADGKGHLVVDAVEGGIVFFVLGALTRAPFGQMAGGISPPGPPQPWCIYGPVHVTMVREP